MPNLYDLERIRDLDLAAVERESARRHDVIVSPGRASGLLWVARSRAATVLRALAVRLTPPVRRPLREMAGQEQLVVPTA